MATALDLITSAARKIGVYAVGETPDADFSANGLRALNSMLDNWQLERLTVYQVVQGSYTWPASTTSRTIGSGGNFAAQRPVYIDAAYVVDSNAIWYPLQVLRDRNDYDSIALKTTTSTYPQFLYMDTAYPLGVIYLWPVPSGELTLKLNTWQTLQSFSALTTDLALPPGYQRAIEFNLAVELHADYPTIPLPRTVVDLAMKAKANLRAINAPSMVASVETIFGRDERGWRYNIYSDTSTP